MVGVRISEDDDGDMKYFASPCHAGVLTKVVFEPVSSFLK